MVSINNQTNELIISIPCFPNETPLERLAIIQKGFQDVMSAIDYEETPKEILANGVRTLSTVLRQFQINERQSELVNSQLGEKPELTEAFNLLYNKSL